MEGAIVTTTANSIVVDFNDFGTAVGFTHNTFATKMVISIRLYPTFVEVYVQDMPKWAVSYALQANAIKVKSIDGVAPTSLTHLYELLQAMIE